MKNKILAFAITAAMILGCTACTTGTPHVSETNGTESAVSVESEKDTETSESWDSLPKKEKKEFQAAYEDAYEDEKKTVDAYVLEYIQNYNEYGELDEQFAELVGTTENWYQTINEFDPNLKAVLAEEAGSHTDSPLESYLLQKGVNAVLDEGKLGQELRSSIEEVGLAVLEQFTIWSMESEKTTRKDAMGPVAVGENYALVRSWGNIGQMLEQIEINSCYTIANKAITDRLELLGYQVEDADAYEENYQSMVEQFTQDLEDEDIDEEWRNDIYDGWKELENKRGRITALLERKEEWEKEIYEEKSDFLKQLGIKQDVDEVIKGARQTDGDDEAYAEDGSENADAPIRYWYVYSIMDTDGNVSGSFFSPYANLNAVVNDEGMCSVTLGDLEDECSTHVVMEKDGTVLFENDEEAGKDGSRQIYYDVTPSKNILRKTFVSDFEHGDYQILEWVKPDGTATKLMEGGYIRLAEAGSDMMSDVYYYPDFFCGDYYEYQCGYDNGSQEEQRGIINMKDGTLITGDDYKNMRENIGTLKMSAFGVETDIWDTQGNKEENEALKNGSRLNKDYILYEDAIYDNSGKEVKKLQEGRGVMSAIYADGEYWVVTNSGWYYVLDDKWNQILKPVELNIDGKYQLTNYGLLVEGVETKEDGATQQVVLLYDDKGEVVQKINNINIFTELKGFILGNEKSGWINLATREYLLLTIPEDGVSLMVQ